MTVSLKHTFQSAVTDGGNASLVQPSNWNAEHTFSMATSRLLGRTTASAGSPEEISVSTGLSLSAGVLTATGTDIIFAAAPNSDFDLNSSTATFFSKSVTGIAAGDQIVCDVYYTILNNSGTTRSITPTGNLGSFAIGGAETTTVAANATNKSPRHLRVMFSVSSTSLANAQLVQIGTIGVAANTPVATNVNISTQLHNTSSSDLTGTQTVSVTVATSGTGGTAQTATLNSYTIRKVSTI